MKLQLPLLVTQLFGQIFILKAPTKKRSLDDWKINSSTPELVALINLNHFIKARDRLKALENNTEAKKPKSIKLIILTFLVQERQKKKKTDVKNNSL